MTRILYVEDNDDNVYSLKLRFGLLDGFEVLIAENGRQPEPRGQGLVMAVGRRNAGMTSTPASQLAAKFKRCTGYKS